MSGSEIAVRLTGVDKAFGKNVVLAGLDLAIPRGKNVVIMGLSGTGKSVTLKILCGLLAADAGEIDVGGIRIDGASSQDLAAARERMGFVFQGAALINWMSARENVALPLRERGVRDADVRARVDARLAAVGLSDIGDKFPDELSGGMRKRVGFARATVLEPALVLYDEPTTGLDPRTTRTIDALMTDARDDLGATGIIVSHNVTSALRVGDLIGLLDNGRIDRLLTPDEFRSSDHPIIRSFVEQGAVRAAGAGRD